MNQSSWFWNNGTMITDLTYPSSNTSVCEQMTWPLTYDDGINLRAKDCETGKSHYICKCALISFLLLILQYLEHRIVSIYQKTLLHRTAWLCFYMTLVSRWCNIIGSNLKHKN